VFPKGKHDDQVDSTAQFLDWFKKPYPGQAFLEYYRMRAECRQNPENPERYRVRLQAPSGQPSRAGTSTSARTAPSKCLPMTPST
jgi:hypothetical protein